MTSSDELTLSQYRKMTETPIPKLILSLAAPTILSMLITSIYNLADTFFVGQISTSASGAVGVVSSLMAWPVRTPTPPPALPLPAFSQRWPSAWCWQWSALRHCRIS